MKLKLNFFSYLNTLGALMCAHVQVSQLQDERNGRENEVGCARSSYNR